MAHLDTRETQQATRRFIKQAMKLPMLELEHEQVLARKWKDQQDENALHELTSAHLRLVVSIASKFVNYGLPMSDLVQEGNIGLMQAAPASSRIAKCGSQPMQAGGSARQFRTMCCAIGRLSAPARPRHKNPYFSTCAVCAPKLTISVQP